MGVTWHDISFMLAGRELGVSYERSLMIGRQWLLCSPAHLVTAYREAGQTLDLADAQRVVREGQGFAEPVFRELGADRVDSLDASDYEGSSIVQDLNVPLREDLWGRYTLVFDDGSLEHVFNLPQALKNCMQAVAPGGHFITITPGNSMLGHGFYQFSPELYYRALAPENGFEVITVLVRAQHRWARWYAVPDPAEVGERVTMSGPYPTSLFVLARRTGDVEPFTAWPQQSDYVNVWSGGTRGAGHNLAARMLQRLPPTAQRGVEALRAATALTGRRSAGHFRRVDLVDVAQGAVPRG